MSDFNEFTPDLFTLEDEEGNEQTFELVDVYTEDDFTYFALIPQQNEEENSDEEDYFVILKRDNNDPDEYLNSIDDEEELDRLAEIFLERLFADEEAEHECHDENCDCCH